MSPLYDPESSRGDDLGRRIRKEVVRRQERALKNVRPMLSFRYQNRFKPPQDDRTWIRLIPEEHTAFNGRLEPYHERMEHFYSLGKRKGKSFICSKSWRETESGELEGDGKCLLCKATEDGAKNISKRQVDAFLLVHLDWYYLVQAIDSEGNKMTYQEDTKYRKRGEPIMARVWQEASREELEWFKITRRKLLRQEKVFGKLMHWSLGRRYFETLATKICDLERHCVCGGRLSVGIYECPNCNNEVFDLTDEGRYLPEGVTVKQVTQSAMNEFLCPHCNTSNLLRPIHECDSCLDPRFPRIWEVDLEVGRIGYENQSQLMIYDHRYQELDDDVVDLIPEKGNLLHRVFAPDSLQYQAKQLGIRNVYADDARRHIEERDDSEEQVSDEDIPF